MISLARFHHPSESYRQQQKEKASGRKATELQIDYHVELSYHIVIYRDVATRYTFVPITGKHMCYTRTHLEYLRPEVVLNNPRI